MFRHCTIDELLALRDTAGTDAARRHVDECAACRAQLERLYQRRAALKSLSSMTAPRDRWPVVRDMVLADRRHTHAQWLGWSGLAAAAVVVVVAGSAILRHQPATSPKVAAVAIDSLVNESQRLEDMLRAVNAHQGVMDGYTASAVAVLEDRIAALDQGIGQAQAADRGPADLQRLWGERVRLLDQLLATHVTRTAYVGY